MLEVGAFPLVAFPFLLAAILAPIFLVFGTVIKPIFVALFCSTERFEQEYGSTGQK